MTEDSKNNKFGPEWKRVSIPNPETLEELQTTYSYWLYLSDSDKEVTEIILAVALDRDIPGDPLWLYVVAPPGAVKTEIVRALNKYSRIYTIDSLTAATFVSGKVEKDKETGDLVPVAGILEDLDGKVLVVKDFTSILSLPDITRSEIFGQLRAIYDGYFEKAFGTLPFPIRIQSRMGLIAAVTPVIDRYTKAHSILGERFLKIRIHARARSQRKPQITQQSLPF